LCFGIVVLSREFMAVPEDEILETQVDDTIVSGRAKYRRNRSPICPVRLYADPAHR
jgi:hypothetical protein